MYCNRNDVPSHPGTASTVVVVVSVFTPKQRSGVFGPQDSVVLPINPCDGYVPFGAPASSDARSPEAEQQVEVRCSSVLALVSMVGRYLGEHGTRKLKI